MTQPVRQYLSHIKSVLERSTNDGFFSPRYQGIKLVNFDYDEGIKKDIRITLEIRDTQYLATITFKQLDDKSQLVAVTSFYRESQINGSLIAKGNRPSIATLRNEEFFNDNQYAYQIATDILEAVLRDWHRTSKTVSKDLFENLAFKLIERTKGVMPGYRQVIRHASSAPFSSTVIFNKFDLPAHKYHNLHIEISLPEIIKPMDGKKLIVSVNEMKNREANTLWKETIEFDYNVFENPDKAAKEIGSKISAILAAHKKDF